jgi:hypothetical protein
MSCGATKNQLQEFHIEKIATEYKIAILAYLTLH